MQNKLHLLLVLFNARFQKILHILSIFHILWLYIKADTKQMLDHFRYIWFFPELYTVTYFLVLG
jgi:hypothetical protein